VLGLGAVDEDELYRALDLLGQAGIERALARRHLKNGCLVLYDLTSSYLEGRCCELAQRGYSRDGRPEKPQIVFGLLCAADGCPVAIEGNTADPKTLSAQIDKLKKRFGLKRVVLVGDRGMITQARIEDDLKPAGLDWITALRARAIQALASANGLLQLSLFDEKDMAEITSPDLPGERLIVCRNPALAEERRRKREDLLAATEKDLARIQAALARPRNPLMGKNAIALKVGAVLGRRKVAKHFTFTITDAAFAFERDQAKIAAEAALDGFYVLRTSVPAPNLDATATVLAYKSLAQVEHAFRCLKSEDLEVRPIHHRLAGRVRAHVFLCMLAYYVQWQMHQKLAPLLFRDHDRPAAAATRMSPVTKAEVSPAAKTKACTRKSADGLPVHSFRTLLADLATLTRNTVRFGDALPMTMFVRPTPLQQRAFDLLAVALAP
jgi:transposase